MSKKRKLVELDISELEAIVARTRTSALGAEDHEKLKATIDTFTWLISELEKKNASLARLRKDLSLSTKKTEKASTVLQGSDGAGNAETQGGEKQGKKKKKKKGKKKPQGHGRNGADAYKGAETIQVAHDSLKAGIACPECEKGKLYAYKPLRLIRLRGLAPIQARIWEIEGLRCNLCGKVFRPEAPAAVGEKKYDETSASMIALLKYGTGLPFYRLEKLQGSLGIPLPAATQWDVAKKAAGVAATAHEELVRQGAQGDIFHNDDTGMKILTLLKENEQIEAAGSKERTGMFTTGIVSIRDGRQIVLFFTGRKHAGENLSRVLEHRASGLDPPIHMCDGLSRNLPKDFETLLVNCLTHGRRKFVEIIDNFPQECRYVIEVLGKVYKNDATTGKQKMSAQDEPNSSLGEAFSYMLKRWDALTLFLREPGAPLDNNICERALKKAILHRKNALFYKTENGARVGDIFMSLIYTAELSGVNPLEYLTALQKHSEELRRSPQEWMPWNYQAAVAVLAKAATARS
jgi:transposase